MSDMLEIPALNTYSPRELVQVLQGTPHLGREHFIAFAEVAHPEINPNIARTAFSALTAHTIFPWIPKYPDLTPYGLVVTTRTEAGMGAIPEFAKVTESATTIVGAEKFNRYAIETPSLGRLVDTVRSGRLEKPRGLGVARMKIINELVTVIRATT